MDKSKIKMDKEYLELIKMCDEQEFDIERAKYLLSLVDVNAFCGEYGHILLYYACDNFEMVKLLVEAGADVIHTTWYCDEKYNDYNPVV